MAQGSIAVVRGGKEMQNVAATNRVPRLGAGIVRGPETPPTQEAVGQLDQSPEGGSTNGDMVLCEEDTTVPGVTQVREQI